MIEGLKKLVDFVHNEGSKIAFQLVHAGRQTTKNSINRTPIAPSKGPRDNIFRVKPKEMKEGEIEEVINAFGVAALRAIEAGSDGVQIHAAHGYLINQFLSPFLIKERILGEVQMKIDFAF
jgi:2,4-dienoyl-CoA reductase-like NADH-dependent reductase (Old Yellow Enzyme family)